MNAQYNSSIVDYDTVDRVRTFLDTRGADFCDIEEEICLRLSRFFEIPTTCTFNCPFVANGSGDIYIEVAPVDLDFEKATLRAVHAPPKSKSAREFKFSSIGEFEFLDSTVYVDFGKPFNEKDKRLVPDLIERFSLDMLRRQYGRIRRAIIDARIGQADDLGSFFHKLIVQGRFLEQLGAEAASVFVVEREARTLRLKGGSGLASGKPLSSIVFHVDHEKHISRIYRRQRPFIQFDGGAALSTGESAELVGGAQYLKIYWPLRLTKNSGKRADERAHYPSIGVLRLVNQRGTKSQAKLPNSAISLRAVSYAAESLYSVVEPYVKIEAASFNRAAAFHNASIFVDTVAKHIRIFHEAISDDLPKGKHSRPALFTLNPRARVVVGSNDHANYMANVKKLEYLLKTAYASAITLSLQIDRTERMGRRGRTDRTEKFVVQVLYRALEMVEFMAAAHSVNEMPKLPTDLMNREWLPPPVMGSPEALISVFANIFENSVKYRKPDCAPEIQIDFPEMLQTAEYVVVRVRDFGIGIEENEHKRIFTAEYRTPRAREFVVRGSGLGLASSRALLELYSGEIWAQRPEGDGNDGLEIFVRLRKA